MKIEMAESLILSWLKHIKDCKIIQLNWKTSPKWEILHKTEIEQLIQAIDVNFLGVFKKNKPYQLISQAEVDALGIKFGAQNNQYYAVDVAFHSGGLGYGGTETNIAKVSEKMLRTALILYAYFATKDGEIIFAAPKINPACYVPLKQRVAEIEEFMLNKGFNYHFNLIANRDFTQIANDIVSLADDVADTSELFLRSCQLYILSQKY